MAQNSWPSPNYNSRNVTDAEYERLASRFSDDGVLGDPSETGVVTAGTGLQVLVRASKYASVRGHAWTSGTVDDPLTISSNSSGSTRTDRVVLRLDRSTWDVRAVVKEGTPGAGAPALTQDPGDTGVFETPLARVVVPDSASSVTVTRDELYVGTRVRPVDSATPNPFPRLGEIQYERDTGRMRFWDGGARRLLYEDTGDITLPSGFSTWEDASGGRFGRRIGALVQLVINVRRTNLNFPTSDTDGSKICNAISSTLRPPGNRYFPCQFSNGASARLQVNADGEVWVRWHDRDVSIGHHLRTTVTYLKP
ncbi:hypothetical protein [Nocardiopsis sp. YSL2]|uniref:hypothetical protein n=1 Tax=Nocardiopsis sp. YSL2 TaxID=2939492 RepID=UPI0026F4491E|nr:hypothetical protein [Nocardiopsis sp. YSL2]